MFFKYLCAEIIGGVIGLIIGVLGLLIGGREIFWNKYFLGIVFVVSVGTGLIIFKMIN